MEENMDTCMLLDTILYACYRHCSVAYSRPVRLWEIGFRLYRMLGVQKHKDRQSLPLIAKRSERTQPEEWAGLRV